MMKRLVTIIAGVIMVLALVCPELGVAGIVAVDDEELAGITAQTGINLYGSLKATAGNLIISGTAGGLKLGGWRLNNATVSTSDPANSSQSGFSQWGPFSFNVGYQNLGPGKQRAVGRIGLDTRVNNDAPTWIFKNIQMWMDEDWSSYEDPWPAKRDKEDSPGAYWNYDWSSTNPLTDLEEGVYGGGYENYSTANHSEAGWIDIGGLYLTTIHLWQTYLDFFNDGQTSASQIQGYGQLRGTVERVTIQWGQAYLDGAAVISNLTFCRDIGAPDADNFMILGDAAGGHPLVWDQTSNFRDKEGNRMFNMRIWFPFEGSLSWDNLAFRDTSYTREVGGGGGDKLDANGYLNLGPLQLDHLKGLITIDFPQQENPAVDWWNY
ncbi:MAG: hypothetical protein JEZ02_12360 [Desulfatibacillum sp.]|nr:hypothetical protein [Desulfatibacillum sp.]